MDSLEVVVAIRKPTRIQRLCIRSPQTRNWLSLHIIELNNIRRKIFFIFLNKSQKVLDFQYNYIYNLIRVKLNK